MNIKSVRKVIFGKQYKIYHIMFKIMENDEHYHHLDFAHPIMEYFYKVMS